MAKKNPQFFGQKILWQAKKKKFWAKNAKIAWKSC